MPDAGKDAEECQPLDAEDFWMSLDEQQQAWAREAVEAEIDLNALQQQLADANATIKRQLIWAQVGMKGKAEDDRENADRLVAINTTVGKLEQQLADWKALCIEEQQRNVANKELFEQVEQQLADARQERDRYREALLEIRAMASVAGYDAGHEGIYSRARAALNPGAKGETDGK